MQLLGLHRASLLAVICVLFIYVFTVESRHDTDFVSFCDDTSFDVEFYDDFDGDKLDENNWTPVPNNSKDNYNFACGREALCRPHNVYLENGDLVLRTHREIDFFNGTQYNETSGGATGRGKRIIDHKERVVRVCVNAKPPGITNGGDKNNGLFPAYWLMQQDPDGVSRCNPDGGEFDMLEMVNGVMEVSHVYHTRQPDAIPCTFPLKALSRHTYMQMPDIFERYHVSLYCYVIMYVR